MNTLGSKEGKALADTLRKNTTLTFLNLIDVLCKNITLTSLNLSENNLGSEGGTALNNARIQH
ncbi:hypothetical protein C2G38_2173599 [Gigaspora rosea]|uniref:Uncharacterized protein n=1 Tax=Gigaspora rosea TaxID=44941 RepID=A0A397VJG4_9GLOM|nr:hypothetical protein C2G38_2173599 [Gigaspora rosea]